MLKYEAWEGNTQWVVCFDVLLTKQRHLRLVATYRSREQFDVGGSRRFFDGRRSREQPCIKSAAVAAKTAGAWKADDVLLSSSRIRSIDRSIICEWWLREAVMVALGFDDDGKRECAVSTEGDSWTVKRWFLKNSQKTSWGSEDTGGYWRHHVKIMICRWQGDSLSQDLWDFFGNGSCENCQVVPKI